MKKNILVIGASGSLGFEICRSLHKVFDEKVTVLVGDYRKERGPKTVERLEKLEIAAKFIYTDFSEYKSLDDAINQPLDCVIVAVKQNKPVLQELCSIYSIPCIDLTAYGSFTNFVENVLPNNGAPSIMMAGFFPGLSGVLVHSAVSDFSEIQQVKVNLVQNKNAQVGLSGIEDMLKIIHQPVGDAAHGFREVETINIKQRTFKIRKIAHDEGAVLDEKLGIGLPTYQTGWNQNGFNHLVSFLLEYGLAEPLLKIAKKLKLKFNARHNDERVYLEVEASGIKFQEQTTEKIQIEATSNYGITADFCALVTKKILNNRAIKGVKYPFQFMGLEVLDQLAQLGQLKKIIPA
ncbi:SDR family oxidoreductase [Enterococcus sp. ALS3]|uniref:SDR family oxidoreductase n=1 Tax=Enterococcus alishanensis TaxID=1303817 RepID=A0ABS6TD13_9ENTE|nr:SDR family oxidoreductase [Enterococcus alishanensis]MBV7390801.1 SDR family oxidoreductase [Enterococcus alishanensis]